MLSGININAPRTLEELCDLILSSIDELQEKITTMDISDFSNQKIIDDDLKFVKRLYERVELGEYIGGTSNEH